MSRLLHRLGRWAALHHWRMIAQLEALPAHAPAWLVKLAPGAVPAGAAPGQRVRLAFGADDAWAF